MSTVTHAPLQRTRKPVTAVVHGMLGKVFMLGLNAVTGIITARALHATGRGEQSAMVLWPAFLVFAASLGLPSSLTYHIRRTHERKGELIGSAFILGISISCITTAFVYAAMPRMLSQYSPTVIFYARVFLLTMPFSTCMLLSRSVFEGFEEFSMSIATQWGIPLFTVVGLSLLWALHALTPVTSAAVYALAVFPITSWLVYNLVKRHAPAIPRSLTFIKSLLSYGIRSFGIDLCTTLSAYVDQAFVVKLLAPQAMGAYVVALSASRILNFCQASVVMVLLPRAASLKPQAAVLLSARAARISMLLTAIAASFAALLAPLAVRIVYGQGFQESVPALRILLAEVTISGTVSVLSQAAMALGRPGVIAILQAVGLAMIVPLLALFVPHWGIAGASWALLISTSLRLVFLLASFPLFLGVPMPRLVLRADDWKELWTHSRNALTSVGSILSSNREPKHV